MNSLSWMIYAAEALDGLGDLATFIAFATAGIWLFGTLMSGGMGYVDDFEEVRPVFRWFLRRVWIPVAAGILSVMIPTQQTIYMIAASEAGETIVKSQEAKVVFEDLKTILKSKLKEQLPKV